MSRPLRRVVAGGWNHVLLEIGQAAGGMSEAAASKAIGSLERQAMKDIIPRAQQQQLLVMSYVQP